jgi:hypothetical protein
MVNSLLCVSGTMKECNALANGITAIISGGTSRIHRLTSPEGSFELTYVTASGPFYPVYNNCEFLKG